MRPILLLITLSAVSCCSLKAQSIQESKFNAGLELSLPVGKFASQYNTGFGGSLKYEYRAGQDFFLSISAGYVTFPLNNSYKQALQQAGNPRSSMSFLPLKIGGKGYISKGFFLEGQLGNAFPINVDRLASSSASDFTFSSGTGYTFDNGLELGFRYEGWFTSTLFSQYVFRFAYRFKL